MVCIFLMPDFITALRKANSYPNPINPDLKLFNPGKYRLLVWTKLERDTPEAVPDTGGMIDAAPDFTVLYEYTMPTQLFSGDAKGSDIRRPLVIRVWLVDDPPCPETIDKLHT